MKKIIITLVLAMGVLFAGICGYFIYQAMNKTITHNGVTYKLYESDCDGTNKGVCFNEYINKNIGTSKFYRVAYWRSEEDIKKVANDLVKQSNVNHSAYGTNLIFNRIAGDLNDYILIEGIILIGNGSKTTAIYSFSKLVKNPNGKGVISFSYLENYNDTTIQALNWLTKKRKDMRTIEDFTFAVTSPKIPKVYDKPLNNIAAELK